MNEPPPRSIIAWQQSYDHGQTYYHYVAINVPGKGWYITGKNKPLSWEELQRRHLWPGQVYIATSWNCISYVA